MFCPQCGQSLAKASTSSEGQTSADAATPPATEKLAAAEPSAKTSRTQSYSPGQQSPTAFETRRPLPGPAQEKNRAEKQKTPSSLHPGKVERTREKLQRASSAARGALEENVKRVDKIRHVSTAVLQEAHYDPSLRFVLVALALFLIFIILLLLSKVMG